MATEFETWRALVEILHSATVLGSPEFNWSAAFCKWPSRQSPGPSPAVWILDFGFLTCFFFSICNSSIHSVVSWNSCDIYIETDVNPFID